MSDTPHERVTPQDLAKAIAAGDVAAVRVLAPNFDQPNQAATNLEMAKAMVELWPRMPIAFLAYNGIDKANVDLILERDLVVDAEGLDGYVRRLSLEQVRPLLDRCTKVGAPYERNGRKINLLSPAAARWDVDTLAELLGRGVKPLKTVYEDATDPCRALLDRRAGDDKGFLLRPYAEGFAGRFDGGFFGFELGKEPPAKSTKLPGLTIKKSKGVVKSIFYRSSEAHADSYEVIAAELRKTRGEPTRAKEGAAPKAEWARDGMTIRLSWSMDVGLDLQVE